MAFTRSYVANTEARISFLHLAAFVATLPIDRFYSQLVLGSFILHTLIHLKKEKLAKPPVAILLLLSSFFLLNIIGLIWSQDRAAGIRDMQRQLAILIFPVLLYLTNLNLAATRKQLFIVFGTSCCLLVVYLYADALRTIYNNDLPVTSIFSGYFINHNFSEPIGMHATYLSVYLALALAAFLVFLHQEKLRARKVLLTLGVLVLLCGLVQLASRAALIATFAFCITGLLFLVAERKVKAGYAVMIILVAALLLIALTGIASFQKRFISEFRKDLRTDAIEAGYTEPRAERWRCAYDLILESPFIGHGSGAEKRLLKEKYYDKKLFNSYLRELNAHNQYLSTWLKWGVAGLLVFLTTIALSLRQAIRRRDPVFFSFLVLTAVVCFSENMLDVNKGIFFFAFFLSFFWLSGKPLQLFHRSEVQMAVDPKS